VQPWTYTFLSILTVSVLALAGLLLLASSPRMTRRVTGVLFALATGALLGGAFLHLMPEAVDLLGSGQGTWLLLLAGFLGFFGLEKVLRRLRRIERLPGRHLNLAVHLNLIGDSVHNFIDGVIIASAYLVSPGTGMVATVAVLAHELPKEIGDFGVFVEGGMSVRAAVLANVAAALLAFVGAGLTLLIGLRFEGFGAYMLPITAGIFCYIAASNLVPQMQEGARFGGARVQFAGVGSGVGLLLLAGALLGDHGHGHGVVNGGAAAHEHVAEPDAAAHGHDDGHGH
jgi:zinc and cadmium transporter